MSMVLLIVASAALVQGWNLSSLSADQAAIVYDQCLARAAVRASRTDAPDTGIYALAKGECATTRAGLIAGRETDAQRAGVLNAIDADKQATFPELTRKVRERRRAFEAQAGAAN